MNKLRKNSLPLGQYYFGLADTLDEDDDRLDLLTEQRYSQGFDASETWDLFTTIAKFILPRLIWLRNHNHGYPSQLTYKKWVKIQNKMIWSFEQIAIDNMDIERPDTMLDYEATEKHTKKIQKGLDLFSQYFMNLWD